ncbi:MAG: HD domain-containing protein [Chlamydiia bacterium]|nr:HD domain-containing protein [Chlamydiia bacterium]
MGATGSRNDLIELLKERESISLSMNATPSLKSDRIHNEECTYRLAFRMDADNILRSKSYARCSDKTQVVPLLSHDHIAHRILHVQLVNSLSQTISEALGLNRDLVEAIALGHDIGHPPFGHQGEELLSSLSIEHGNGPFAHPYQSCRQLTEVEPLNLSLQVLDGILCHDGSLHSRINTPNRKKSWAEFQREMVLKKSDPDCHLTPMTMEGALVKICDTVSYLVQDLKDGIRLGLVNRSQIPDTLLGTSDETILAEFSRHLIDASTQKDAIILSEPLFAAIKQLRAFNFESIYFHPMVRRQTQRIRRSYGLLFRWLIEDEQHHREESYLWREFLNNKSFNYIQKTSPIQRVVDFVAGMTDGYFIKTLERLFVPTEISWHSEVEY